MWYGCLVLAVAERNGMMGIQQVDAWSEIIVLCTTCTAEKG
jgi:hypothetical protein